MTHGVLRLPEKGNEFGQVPMICCITQRGRGDASSNHSPDKILVRMRLLSPDKKGNFKKNLHAMAGDTAAETAALTLCAVSIDS